MNSRRSFFAALLAFAAAPRLTPACRCWRSPDGSGFYSCGCRPFRVRLHGSETIRLRITTDERGAIKSIKTIGGAA